MNNDNINCDNADNFDYEIDIHKIINSHIKENVFDVKDLINIIVDYHSAPIIKGDLVSIIDAEYKEIYDKISICYLLERPSRQNIERYIVTNINHIIVYNIS